MFIDQVVGEGLTMFTSSLLTNNQEMTLHSVMKG